MKGFERKKTETGAQFAARIGRYQTDKIIEQISYIADLESVEIKRILQLVAPEALEIIEDECNKLEKFEASKIARELREEKL